MRVVRFETQGRVSYGVLQDGEVRVLSRSPFAGADSKSVLRTLLADKAYRLDQVTLLAPCEPSKFVGVGLNYRATAEALNLQVPDEPLLYLKPSTGIVGPGAEVVLPAADHQVMCEGELALVIGRTGRNIAPKDVPAHVLGYIATNDLTDVTQYMSDHGNPTRAKLHDTFAPIGPWIETELDPREGSISTRINGREVQRGRCGDMIFSVERCVSFISSFTTLLAGDVIALGAPPVPAPVRGGDLVEVAIDGIGVLVNRIAVRE